VKYALSLSRKMCICIYSTYIHTYIHTQNATSRAQKGQSEDWRPHPDIDVKIPALKRHLPLAQANVTMYHRHVEEHHQECSSRPTYRVSQATCGKLIGFRVLLVEMTDDMAVEIASSCRTVVQKASASRWHSLTETLKSLRVEDLPSVSEYLHSS
jgi:hypothetical protein